MAWGPYIRSVVAVNGPFRAQLSRPIPSREIQHRADAFHSINAVVYNATLHPEPGLYVRRIDSPRVIEAVDDRGQSLESEETDEQIMINEGRRTDPTNQGISASTTIKLLLPKNAGKVLKHLKIAVPIVIAAHRPDSTEIPLVNVAGKSFSVDNGLIRFGRLSTEPGGLIEVTVTDFNAPPEEQRFQFGRQGRFGGPDFLDGSLQDPQTRLALVDRDGNLCRWDYEQPEFPIRFRRRQRNFMAAGERKLLLRLADDSPAAAKLLYRGVIEAETEAVFEFDDVPLR